MDVAGNMSGGSVSRLRVSLDGRLPPSPKILANLPAGYSTVGSSIDQEAFDSMLSEIYLPGPLSHSRFVEFA